MEITRRSVLADALQYRQSLVRKFSRDSRGLVARTGYQEEFARYSEECRILRELMQALEYEPVRAAMAEFLGKDEAEEPQRKLMIYEKPLKEWQKQVLEGMKKQGLFCDEYQAANSADYPERRNVPGWEDLIQR